MAVTSTREIEKVSDMTLDAARTGDGAAFQELTQPYWQELRVHCYRILGSVQDAEDILQETMLAAWRGLDRFEGRSSVRTWLYRIATNRCLNALRDDARRPQTGYQPEVALPPPTRTGDVSWVQPYPDLLLEGMPDGAPGPDARYELKESVSLAFVTAVQTLLPRQRAVLLLRDVLGYRAAEVAGLLETTQDAVNSALKRARAVLAERMPEGPPPAPASARERELADRFAEAFAAGDVAAVIELLTGDAWLSMPPLPHEYQGREAIGHFLATVPFRQGRRYRLVPTRANGAPAFGAYLLEGAQAHGHGVVALTVTDAGISAMTRFIDTAVMAAFGLPLTLPR
jgi:RNA polymerase sigma-70 factor (TIGR02960 family)